MEAVVGSQMSKSYGKLKALDGLDLRVGQGEVYGIIGPDGAGKTTLFRILATLLLPDSGTARLMGYDVVRDYRAVRSLIGYMPGRFSLYQDLTVEENLRFFASVFRTTVEENYALVADIYRQIEPFRHRKAGKLSGGMKQKLALSCALIHRPQVLLLDEPTTGVDPVSRKELWGMLLKLKAEGIAILVSTPYMDEAALCDRIALVQGGRFLGVDTPQGLVESYPETLWSVQSDRMHQLLADLRDCPGVRSYFSFGTAYHVTFEGGRPPQALNDYLARRGHRAVDVHAIKPSVEDCFMRLSKR